MSTQYDFDLTPPHRYYPDDSGGAVSDAEPESRPPGPVTDRSPSSPDPSTGPSRGATPDPSPDPSTGPSRGATPDPSATPSPDPSPDPDDAADGWAQPGSPEMEEGTHDRTTTTDDTGEELSDEELIEKFRKEYGWLTWMLDHPELGPILEESIKENWSSERTQTELQNTDWFQETSPALREWKNLKNTDPADAQNQINAVSQRIKTGARRYGVELTPHRAEELAEKSLSMGWVDGNAVAAGGADPLQHPEIRSALAYEFHYDPAPKAVTPIVTSEGDHYLKVTSGDDVTYHSAYGQGQREGIIALYGDPIEEDVPSDAQIGERVVDLYGGPNGIEEVIAGKREDPVKNEPVGDIHAEQDQLREMVDSYMIPVSDATIERWATDIFEGEATQEAFNSMLQQQARDRFPHLSTHIDSGITPEQYFHPYKELIANELEYASPEQIDLMNDSRFSNIVEGPTQDGEYRPLTLHETRQQVRSTDEWQSTSRANEEAGQMVETIGRMFGRVG